MILDKDDGTDHAWKRLDNGRYVTLEYAKESSKDGTEDVYVCAYVTDTVDSDGYFYGVAMADAYPDSGCSDEELVRMYRYLIKEAKENRNEEGS